jgi:hypothetical protein
MKDDQLVINWSTSGPVPAELLKFIHCGCKTGKCDSGRCSCFDAKLPCTDYCKCMNIMCNNRDVTAAEVMKDCEDERSDDSDSDSDL